MAFKDHSKAKTWRTYYSNLLNVEFSWNHDLSNEPAVHSPPILITEGMIRKVISQIKNGKTTGPSELTLEMILASQQHITTHLTSLQITSQKEKYLRIGTYLI